MCQIQLFAISKLNRNENFGYLQKNSTGGGGLHIQRSIRLKLNLSKLKRMPIKFKRSELPALPAGIPKNDDPEFELYVEKTELLGFGFGIKLAPPSKLDDDGNIVKEYEYALGHLKVTADFAADNLKSRLNASCRIVATSMKTIRSLKQRIQVAMSQRD